VISEHNRFSIA